MTYLSQPSTNLFGEVLNDAVLRHLGADGEAPLQLLLDARDHFLVFLRGEALHSYRGEGSVEITNKNWKMGKFSPFRSHCCQ